jgi:hypothetical protein
MIAPNPLARTDYNRVAIVIMGESMMHKGLAAQRLVAVFLTAALLFNYPVLSLFDRRELLLGLPMAHVVAFLIWAAVIAVMAWIVERSAR